MCRLAMIGACDGGTIRCAHHQHLQRVPMPWTVWLVGVHTTTELVCAVWAHHMCQFDGHIYIVLSGIAW